MSILLLMDKLTTGGAEVYFVKLENSLNEKNVDVYTAAGPGELINSLKRKDKFTLLSKSKHFRNIREINKIITSKKIKLIHANSLRVALYSIFLNCLRNRKKKIKIVYSKHNVTILEKKFLMIFKFLLNNYIERIITVCNAENKHLQLLGINENKIITIHNGVDLDQFHKTTDKHLNKEEVKIGILARLSPEKNHSFFLEVAALFKEKKKYSFFIAGDGPEEETILKKINALHLTNTVNLCGNVKNPEFFLNSMDIILLTSFREVFPMTIIEAMAIGTPVISIDVGGISEAIIDNENGYLIKKYQAQDFYNKITYLAGNNSKYNEISKKSALQVKNHFGLEDMVNKIIYLYQTLILK